MFRSRWVSLYHYAVNLNRGQPRLYWCLCCVRTSKWYEIVRFFYQTQGQHIPWTWLCPNLELTPLKFMTSRETQEYWLCFNECKARSNYIPKVGSWIQFDWPLHPFKHNQTSERTMNLLVFVTLRVLLEPRSGQPNLVVGSFLTIARTIIWPNKCPIDLLTALSRKFEIFVFCIDPFILMLSSPDASSSTFSSRSWRQNISGVKIRGVF